MTDFAGLMPAVADALAADGLLPEPTPGPRRDGERRYGKHGSLSLDLSGMWHDHEAGVGGGVLDLVKHLTGRDPLDWLADRRLIDPPRGSQRPRKRRKRPRRRIAPARQPESRPEPVSESGGVSERVERARKLLAAAEPLPWPDDEAGGPWPAEHPAFQWRDGLLTATGEVAGLLWIEADALGTIPKVYPAPGAAGAILTPRAPLAAWLSGEPPDPQAVEVEYLAADGGPVEDAAGLRKRTYGTAAGAVWSARPGPGRVHLAEGVADALSVAPHLPAGDVIAATGGTSGLQAAALAAAKARRALVIHADSDGPGAAAAHKAIRQFQRLAPRVEVRWLQWSPDPDAERRAKRRACEPLNLPPWLYSGGEAAADVSAPAA